MTERSQEQLLHVLDLALSREWGQAKALAETLDDPVADRVFLLVSEIEEREEARTRHLALVRHEIGNALSIAQANLEAMVDGILDPTPQRLDAILRALSNAAGFLEDLRRGEFRNGGAPERNGTFDIRDLVEAQLAAVARLAGSKRVTLAFEAPEHPCEYTGDIIRIGTLVRDVLLNAIRATEPGGTIRVGCTEPLAIHVILDKRALPVMQRALKSIPSRVTPAEGEFAALAFDLPASERYP